MDTATLVDEQIDEGKLLVDHLKSVGVDVTVAFWVLTSDERLWLLYIASSLVDTDGLAAAFRRIYSELGHCQVRWVSRSDIKLIGSRNPIALDAIAYQRDTLPARYSGRKLGNMIIEEAYIYPR